MYTVHRVNFANEFEVISVGHAIRHIDQLQL